MPGSDSDSGSEYDAPNADSSIDSGSDSEYEQQESQGFRRLDADSDSQMHHQSVYLSEKSNKKRLVIKDGKIMAKMKAQRKDKG